MSSPATDLLAQAHAELRIAVRKERRAFRRSPKGVLAQTVMAVITRRDQMRADGATEADLNADMETAIRQCWPFTREWKYLCDKCDDHGLAMGECPGDATCGRTLPHMAHSFGTPCWCSAGNRFKAKARPTGDDDLATVGKTRKNPRGFTRFGR